MGESGQSATAPRPPRAAAVFAWMGAAGMTLVVVALVARDLLPRTGQARLTLANDLGWILVVIGALGRLRVRTFGNGTTFLRAGTWLQAAMGAVYLGFRAFQLLRG